MPELPEVETIRLGLLQKVVHKRINRIKIDRASLIKRPSPRLLASKLVGSAFLDVQRRGKYLVLPLRGGELLVVHLGMTGSLRFSPPRQASNGLITITFGDGSSLFYQDKRCLGRIILLEPSQAGDLDKTLRLGPEPFSEEFLPRLERELKKSRRSIKQLLLDQSKVAGLGNIYACEALFAAAIHPLAKCSSLNGRRVRRLHQAIVETLKQALASRGTTFSDYQDASGQPGEYQNYLQVYGREGQSCPRCQGTIARLKHQGRSSYFCPRCQKR